MQSSHSSSGGNQASDSGRLGHDRLNQAESGNGQSIITDDRESHDLTFETEMAIEHENSKFLQLHAFKPALLC